MKKLILLTALLLTVFSQLYSQQFTNFTVVNTSKTIASNNVQSIAIDAQGNKWFGTNSGVSKFDGTTWTTYTTADGLGNSRVNSIAIDAQGNKWFGTYGGGVSKFDGTTWTTYTTANGLANNNVFSIAIDAQGNKWFGTYDGVSKFDDTTWTTYNTANGLVNSKVHSIAIDAQGNKWFGTEGGVSKFDDTTWTNYTTANGLTDNYVNSIAIDAQGNKWFGTYIGYLSKFDGKGFSTIKNGTGFRIIAIDAQGNKWFGTSGGVIKLNGNTWTDYYTANRLAYNNVYSIAIDAQGNKWIGTDSGVSRFDGTSWTTYTTNGLADNYINSIAIDAQGNKWFGTNGEGGSKFDDATWTTYTTTNGLANDYIYSIAIDAQGNKWFGASGGVSKFDGTTWTTYTTDNGLADNCVRSIAIDALRNKWFGTAGGVSKFDGTSWITYSTVNGLAYNWVESIAIDAQGNKWFGTYRGVSKFDGTTWTTYTTANGLANNCVRSIAIDAQGNKWFGTDGGGVSKFDGSTWTTYTTANGLANNSIRSIAIDAQGNKWFGTDGGVSKFDGTTWTTYTTDNGLADNCVRSIAIDAQGNKWFGTYGGVSRLNGSTNLSASSINENVTANSTIGLLSTMDAGGTIFTYSLVTGTGDTDNASFTISGKSLVITNSPNYEVKNSYSVCIRTNIQGGISFDKAFTITINNVNEAPTDITLSASAINENVVANSTVGTLTSTDADAGDTFTYSLISGTGSTDNASFSISENLLRINNSPDFESKSSYSVRILATDKGFLTYEKVFSISINDINETPTNISLSASAINENVVANSTIGTLSTTDPDVGNTFIYTLVAGTGSTDNASFNISGSSLRITASPDYETKSSYTVRVRTTDGGSLFFEKAFTIAITNVNEAPTDIALSASAINENVVANSTVGTLSTTDPDAGNTFTYSLVSGTGSTDNASFNISGSSLRITGSPDFETKSSYTVRVRTTDGGSLFFEKTFTVTINNVNEAPTDIALSASAINENVVANSTVGTLSTTDPDAGNTFTYSLVSGTGSTDNTAFNISGSSLRITASPDFETKSSYSVRVRTTDGGSLFFEKTFTVTINNVNEAPTDIALSAAAINENVVANSSVGTLSPTDPDAGNTFTYTLVSGTGSTDNAAFNISGSSLRITNSPDYETKSSYSVRVRTTDGGSLFFEKAFTVTINNVNEAPSEIALSANAISENVVANSTVGTLSTTDPDAGNTFTYSLVSGTGSTDNTSFNISGSSLRITASPDYETKSSYSVRVRTTDQGDLYFEKAFTITINNVNEAPAVTTQPVSNIGSTIATGNGTISLLGDPNPTAYGVCWNITGTPTIMDSKVNKGTATAPGEFTAAMTNLSANTKYYVRAYIINSMNIIYYGEEVTFTTLSASGLNDTENLQLTLYPNPVTDAFRINGLNGVSSVSLTDLSGRTLIQKQVSDNEAVSVSTLPTGIYILKIKNNEGTAERKVVKK